VHLLLGPSAALYLQWVCGGLNALVRQFLTRISAPTTPPVESPVDDSEDSLFIPEDPSTAPQPAEPAATAQFYDPVYLEPCDDVKTAEGQWDRSSTHQGMAKLQKWVPLLQPMFLKCLVIARRTLNEVVVHEWRELQEQGWRRDSDAEERHRGDCF
jgi:hypothetical protein